jgi:hypothetical protein
LAAAWANGALAAASAPDWDRVDNIKAAAKQIGEIQANSGVEQAFKFISACYKTHSLAAKYSKAFEGCIAQDFIVSRALIEIYMRVPQETLQKMGAPSPEQIHNSFQARASSAFAQYDVASKDVLALRDIAEKHGIPVFLKIVFPKSDDKSSPQPEPKK